jgi:hypothetical protein
MIKNIITIVLPLIVSISIISCNSATNSNCSQSKQDSVCSEKKVTLSDTKIKNLNAYFTCFSEIYLPEFSKGNITDSILIQFGVYYNYRNHFSAFKQIAEGSKASISEIQVADSAFKFFGIKISKHQSIDEIEYNNKKYIIVNSDGEAYRFSQLRELSDIGGGLYSAIIEIYSASSGFTGDVNASPETWKTNTDEAEIPASEGKMKAIIRKTTKNGDNKYVLLEYLK